MSHIFVSYSRKDSKIVAQYVESLRKQDFVVWQDVSSISAGDEWFQAIMDAVEQSAAVLVFWSQAASLSNTINNEIEQAIKTNRKIIPVWLEKATPLRDGLREHNAIISSGFSPNAVQKIVSALLKVAPRVQRQVSGVDLSLPMKAQTVDGITREMIGDREYVVMPLVDSVYSRAHLIAEAGTIVQRVSRIQLMVQCTRSVGYTMPRQVFELIAAEDKEYPDDAEPRVGLYVTGPLNPTNSSEYQIDPRNVAHYSDLLDTTRKAIAQITNGSNQNQTFQVFQQVLVDIAFLLGVYADRWLPFQLYKWVGDQYVMIMNIPPRIPN